MFYFYRELSERTGCRSFTMTVLFKAYDLDDPLLLLIQSTFNMPYVHKW